MARIVITCDHGKTERHLTRELPTAVSNEGWCEGGRFLDPGSFVLIERNEEEEWPDRTVVAVLDAIRNGDEWGEGWEAWDMARTVLDALAGGEQP